MKRLQAGLSITIFSLTALLGVGAFLYPFWLPAVVQNADAGGGMAHSGDSPLMLTAIVGICFAVLLVEVQAQAISAQILQSQRTHGRIKFRKTAFGTKRFKCFFQDFKRAAICWEGQGLSRLCQVREYGNSNCCRQVFRADLETKKTFTNADFVQSLKLNGHGVALGNFLLLHVSSILTAEISQVDLFATK